MYTIGYAYDRNGRRTILKHDTVVAPPNGNDTTKYGYDAVGRLRRITDPLSRIYRFTYDAESRPDSVLRPFRTTIKYTYDGDSRVATRTDDGDKWMSAGTFTVDALHRDTIWYDARGRVRRVRTNSDSTENSYAPLGLT